MPDFGTLPPEITSARMYAGPGSGPLMAAAAAWDALAVQLESVARGYAWVIAGLQGESWSGPASMAMANAAAPYAEWATAVGAQVEQVASRARAAAVAYEAAFAATVPPALVTANRTQLAQLVASNTFGQNTTSIAATEAAYAQMWAQDAQAMYGYAAASSTATELTPFTEAPPTTNAAGQATQNAAVAHAAGVAAATHSHNLSQAMSTVPQQLQTLSTAGSSGSPLPIPPTPSQPFPGFDAFNTLTGPTGFATADARTVFTGGSFLAGVARVLSSSAAPAAAAAPATASAAAPPVVTAGAVEPAAAGVRNAVLASVGEAAPMGQLSVPQAWADATPVAAAAEDPSWLSEAELAAAPAWEEAVPAAGMEGAAPTAGMGPMAAMAPMAGGGRPTVSSILRVGPRRFSMPRPSSGG
jgi:PPE-repeat protein